ncbi:uncharacterized protein LOC110227553 [Arabidopsis lyrata subsp. lyrata]|uniref:uncharacterized protein LOC110227553 n=1 Tax=Arabidopsis lyrata subsp. lyrata TaxID=81972 RepID=UPI000A29A7DC|nr:uncharacterized protein LOC110227553 [Arabidopsis lyrata subsp. lyrata]|eukprot:XP_020877749.1 uncharacterized protein LOC110227553 [Arabidopsis lyrata subsp. lyrata]
MKVKKQSPYLCTVKKKTKSLGVRCRWCMSPTHLNHLRLHYKRGIGDTKCPATSTCRSGLGLLSKIVRAKPSFGNLYEGHAPALKPLQADLTSSRKAVDCAIV